MRKINSCVAREYTRRIFKVPSNILIFLNYIFVADEEFLIKTSSNENLCLTWEVERFKLKHTCNELFAYREDFCLFHLKTNMVVMLGNNKLDVGHVCRDQDKVRLNNDGRITEFYSNSKCIIGCTTDSCDLKSSSSPPQQDCLLFSFVTGKLCFP